MRWPKYTKAKQDEAILQNSEVVNEIPIINSLEKGNITRALKGERVGTIIFKE
jgi:molybdenum storage protein